MIRIDLNAEEALAGLARLRGKMGDMSEVMADIGELLVASTKDRFRAGVAPDGTPWAPKTQTTIDAYLARGDRVDPRPLFGPSGRLSSEIFYESGPDHVEVGSNLIYAAVMQLGAGKGAFAEGVPWGDVPARTYLGVSHSDILAFQTAIYEYFSAV